MKLKFFQSIKWKVVIIYILLLLIAMQVIGIYFIRTLEVFYLENYSLTLHSQANLLAVNIAKIIEDPTSKEQDLSIILNDLIEKVIEANNIEVIVLNENGFVMGANEANNNYLNSKINNQVVYDALKGVEQEDNYIERETNKRYKYLAIPIKEGERILGAIFIKASLDEVYDLIKKVTQILTTGTIFALLSTAVLGYILAEPITKPLKEMTSKAKAIANGDYSQKVKVYGNDEIGQLANTFNYMVKRLKGALSEKEEEKEKLTSVLANISDGIIGVDEKGKIIVCNQQVRKILQEEEPLLGKEITKLIPILEEPYTPLLEKKSIVFSLNKDEKKITKVTIIPIHRHSEREIGTIFVIEDVTEQEKLEKERKEFVANVSHELRTPITIIKSYLEALPELDINRERERFLHFIDVALAETDRMGRLISDLTSLSRLDENMMPYEPRKFNLTTLIEDVLDRFYLQLQEKELAVELEIFDEEKDVFADPDQIDQVFNNIISNAIKYTEKKGLITIRTESLSGWHIVYVKDNGIGIKPEDLARIFERFYRTDKARSRKMGGTGLGLSIAKELVELNKGEISIQSKLDKGTTVTFKIPSYREHY